MKLNKLLHIKSFIRLFYEQKNPEIINEMSSFLFKLYNFKNQLESLCDINKKNLKKNNYNAIKFYMHLLEELENNYLEENKSHFSFLYIPNNFLD